MVYLSLLLLLAGSHSAVFQPTGANRGYPTWFLAVEYFLFVDGMMVLVCFALLDKRRLRRRFDALERYRGWALAKLWLKIFGILTLALFVIILVANATGVVNTAA